MYDVVMQEHMFEQCFGDTQQHMISKFDVTILDEQLTYYFHVV